MRPLVEIEQKFAFNPALLARFRANQGVPPFRSLHQPQPATSSFRDRYYDSAGRTLEKQGIWLRQREGTGWEVKQRLRTPANENNTTYLRSTFVELRAPAAIHGLVRAHVGADTPGPERAFGLELVCDFRTERERATVDDAFAVVLDRTCFGHAVGEVELMDADGPAGDDGHGRIDDFMTRYAWFFRRAGPKPKGKLSAYFERFGHPTDAGGAKERFEGSIL